MPISSVAYRPQDKCCTTQNVAQGQLARAGTFTWFPVSRLNSWSPRQKSAHIVDLVPDSSNCPIPWYISSRRVGYHDGLLVQRVPANVNSQGSTRQEILHGPHTNRMQLVRCSVLQK